MSLQYNILLSIASCFIADAVHASEAAHNFSNEKTTKVWIKTSKDFVGGEVQVFSASSSMIVSQKMRKRKVSIDFTNVMVGEYTIKILKGTQSKEYHFLKK
jgi:hypothetical protein